MIPREGGNKAGMWDGVVGSSELAMIGRGVLRDGERTNGRKDNRVKGGCRGYRKREDGERAGCDANSNWRTCRRRLAETWEERRRADAMDLRRVSTHVLHSSAVPASEWVTRVRLAAAV